MSDVVDCNESSKKMAELILTIPPSVHFCKIKNKHFHNSHRQQRGQQNKAQLSYMVTHNGNGKNQKRRNGNHHSKTPIKKTKNHAINSNNNNNKTKNILDLPRVEDLNDFVWVMQDEPHASRRKQLMKDHSKAIQPLLGYEWKTKYIVIILVGIQLYLSYYLREEALWGGTLKFYLIAWFVGAPITQALFLAVHEISHNLAFKSYTANKYFGIFTNIPMVLPFFVAFKYYHNEHHKFQGFDGVDTDLPTAWEAKLLSNRAGKLFFMFNQTWFYAFRPLFVRPQALTKWHVLNASTQISFIVSTVFYFGVGPILYLLLCAHISGGWHPLASHFIAEHYVFSQNVETASYYGWMNYLTWNVGYHNEHHDFPTVPWSRLPSLSKVGKYRETLPYHESWVKVLIEFVFNDHVTFYNRIKRKPVSGEAKLFAEHKSAGIENNYADYNEKFWVKE